MSKYSTQFKLAVVRHYLQFGGVRQAAKRFEISSADIRKWTLAYQAHGLSSLQRRSSQHYTIEFKLAVLQYMKDHLASARPTAAHFNIASASSITVWRRLYNEGGIEALQLKPKGRPPMAKPSDLKALLKKPIDELNPAEMRRRLEYLEVENAYLKKLEALAQQKHLASKNKSK